MTITIKTVSKQAKKPGMIKKTLKILLWLALTAAIAVGTTNIIMVSSANKHIFAQADAKKADAIIVLGAKVWTSGQPSYMLQDRLDVASELYYAGAAPRVLVSGDHGTEEYDEVNNMRRYLEDKGVPTEAIFMDHAGFDTYSTMYRARDVFVVKSAIVVTQKYHLYRAVFLADSMGIDAQGVACDRYKSKYQLYYSARELLARTKDWFEAEVTKPKPKYLGDAIPISGSGLLTHDVEP